MRKSLLALLTCYVFLFSSVTKAGLIDIAFIMDASGSVGDTGWEIEKSFVVELAAELKGLETSEFQFRFGAISFSNGATLEWGFNDEQDPFESFANHILNIPYATGYTHTQTALNTTLDLFDSQSLPSAYQKAFLITDGVPYPTRENPCLVTHINQQYLDAAEATRERLNNSNVDIDIIGVGENWNPDMLNCVVDDPNEDIYRVDSFNSAILSSIVDQIKMETALQLDESTSIPEPSTFIIFATGLFALVMRKVK